MFAVIYRFKLKPEQESEYRSLWNTCVQYFKKHSGAIGSTLHKDHEGNFIAYSRWPSREMRDLAWPGENNPDRSLPEEIKHVIERMQEIAKDNESIDPKEITLDILEDQLL